MYVVHIFPCLHAVMALSCWLTYVRSAYVYTIMVRSANFDVNNTCIAVNDAWRK